MSYIENREHGSSKIDFMLDWYSFLIDFINII